MPVVLGERSMSDKFGSGKGAGSVAASPVAPSIVPDDLNAILQDADALLVLMSQEPLQVVTELADELARSAHQAGAVEIEAAASDIRRLASGKGPVALTGAMHALTTAIAHTESILAA
jgi:hypothetical protein